MNDKKTETGHTTHTKVVKTNEIQGFTDNQSSYPTWMLIVGLILAFIILKTFIYIKDDKRHGK